jgi:hypothetical protein
MDVSCKYLVSSEKDHRILRVTYPQNEKKEKVERSIFKALTKASGITSLKFSSKEGETLDYEVKEKDEEGSIFGEHDQIQLTRFDPKQLPLKLKTVGHIFQKMQQRWASGYSIIDIGLSIVLYPLALWAYFRSPSNQKQIDHQLEKYIKGQTPASFKDLFRLLKQRQDMLKRRDESLPALDQVIAVADRITKGEDLKQICNNALLKNESMVLPGGYYESDGLFVPVFYRLREKNEEGKRTLEIYFLSENSEKISCAPLSDEELRKKLVSLLSRGLDQKEGTFKKQAEVYLQAAQKLEKPQEVSVERSKKDLSLSPRDHLLSEVKVQKTESICGEVLTLFHEGKKREYLALLLTQIIKDETYLLSKGSHPQTAPENLGKIKRQLEELLSSMSLSAKDLVDSPEEQSTLSSDSFIHLGKKGEMRTGFGQRLSPEFYQWLNQVKVTMDGWYASANPKDALNYFKSRLDEANNSMAQGECQEGYEIALTLLMTLPCPNPYFKTEGAFWSSPELNTMERLDEFSHCISDATTILWEASLRLEKNHMTPQEYSALVLSRAALVKIARQKSIQVKQKIQQNGSNRLSSVSSFFCGLHKCQNISEADWKTMKEGGLTYEEASSLVFDDFQTNTHLFRDLFFHHPHLRLGLLPKEEKKIAGALTYLETVNAPDNNNWGKVFEGAAVIRLDAQVDAPVQNPDTLLDQARLLWKETYSQTADTYYLREIKKIAQIFGRSTEESTLWEEVDPQKPHLLPVEMIHLRRHVMMFQNLLQPEFSMALHFGRRGQNALAAVNWWRQLEKEALKRAEGDLEKKNRWMLKIGYGQLQQQLQKMKGRLRLSVGPYVTNSSIQAIIIENNQGEKVYYVPWGIGLPDALAVTFQTSPNEMNSATLAGNVPISWLVEGVGIGGSESFLNPTTEKSDIEEQMKRKKSTVLFKKRYFPDECAQMSRLMEESDDAIKEYLLRTLKVSSDPKRVAPQFSAIRESLVVIFGRPDLILDRQVRARFDLLLSEPFQLQGFIRQYPNLLPQIATMLREVIDEALSKNQVEVALFLIRLGQLFREHLEAYQAYPQEEPYRGLLSLTKTDISGNMQAIKSFSRDILKKMPGYATDLSKLNEQEQKFPDLIRLARVESLYFKQRRSTTVYFVTNLLHKELADLIQLKQSLEGSIDHLGTPMFNQEILDWIVKDLFPQVDGHLTQDSDARKEVLNLLANEYSEGDWVKKEDKPYVYQKGNVTLNIDTLIITGKKENHKEVVKCKTELPSKIIEGITGFDRFFKKEIKEVVRYFDQERKGWIYELPHHYRIIDRKGTNPILEKEDQGKTWRLVSCDKGSGTLFEIAKAFSLWETTDENKHYSIPTDKGTFSFKMNQEGKVEDLRWEGKEVVEAPQAFAHCLCPAASSSYVFCSKDQTKIYLVDQGATLEKEDEKWHLGGTEQVLVQQTPKGKSLFFHHLLGNQTTLHFQSDAGDHFLIWPYSMKKGVREEDPSLAKAQERPQLQVTLKKEGTLETSAGGFLYLAYRAISQGRVEASLEFLKRAEKKGLSGRKSKEDYLFISELLRKEAKSAFKDALFYLKALYTLSVIEKEQKLHSTSSLEDKKGYFLNVTEIAELYERVYRQGEESKLTPDEQRHFEDIKREGLRALLSHAAEETKESYQAFSALHKSDLDDNFYSYLASILRTDKEEFQIPPLTFSPQKALAFFDQYIGAIQDGTLHQGNMDFLFVPFVKGSDPLLKKAGETARRLLIQLILVKGHGVVNQLDCATFDESRSKVPLQVSDRKRDLVWEMASQQLRALKKGEVFFDFDPIAPEAVDVLKQLKAWVQLFPLDIESNRDKYLSNQGMKTEEEVTRRAANEVDIGGVQERFEQISQEIQLNPTEKTILDGAFQQLLNQEIKTISLPDLMEILDEALKISSVEMRREALLAKEIQDLENTFQVRPERNQKFTPISFPEGTFNVSETFALNTYFAPIDSERSDRLTKEIPDAIKNRFVSDSNDPSLHEEYRQIQEGAEEARIRISREIPFQRRLQGGSLGALKDKVNRELDPKVHGSIKGKYLLQKQKLCDEAQSSRFTNLSSRLQEMAQTPELFCEEDWMDEVFDLYQLGEPSLDDAFCQDIELFLRYATYVKQLEEAQKWIGQLEAQNPSQEEDEFQLCEILGRRLHLTRYTDMKQDVGLMRKLLVSEYRMGMILRQGQIETIQEIRNNFNAYYSLRMGEGKTSGVIPVSIALLIEQGKLPMVLVPREQLSLNRESFDGTTRRVFGLRARVLEIDPEKISSPAYVAEIYLNCLKAFKDNGYFVLTPDQLTTVMNLVEDLKEERKKCLERAAQKGREKKLSLMQFADTDEGKIEALSLQKIEKSLFHLRKIELLFDSQGQQPQGIEVAFFADEIDSLFHITKENNRAIGEKVPFDQTVIEVISTVFDSLLENQNLCSTLIAGKKISEEGLRTWAKKVAESLQLGTHGEQTPFIDYLLGKSETLPQGLGEWKGTLGQKKIATLKLFFSATFLSLLPSLQYKFDEEVGHLIVPAELGKSQNGDRFGQEIAIIAIQHLGYLQAHLCQSKGEATETFFAEIIATLAFRKPQLYRDMVEKFRKVHHKNPEEKALAKWVIEEPSCAPYRLAILKEVFDRGLMKRYKEQITLPVQGAVSGRLFGGVTGTLNPYALPALKNQQQKEKGTRGVEVETFIKVAVSNPQGLTHPLASFEGEKIFEFCADLLKAPESTAIIDEGGYLSRGRSIKESIEKLSAQSPDTTFLYPDRVENEETKEVSTELFLKRPGQPPTIISKEGVKKLKERYITVFSPEYTRGTDLPILKGQVHYFPSKGTNLQDMGQSIWRGRQTGVGHSPQNYVPLEVYSEGMTLLDFFKWVTKQGMDQQLPSNCSAAQLKIREIGRKGVAVERNQFSPHEKEKEHWDPDNGKELYLHMRFDNALHEIFRDFKIKGKATDFKGGYVPGKEVKTQDQIQGVFEQEKALLLEKQRALIEKATSLFFTLAVEGEEDENLWKKFEGIGQAKKEELAVLLDAKGRPNRFKETMETLNKATNDKEKDRIIAHQFFAILFGDMFVSQGEDGLQRIGQAVDRIEERMVDFLVNELEDKLGTMKSHEEFKKLIKTNLNQSIDSGASFSDLMVASTKEFGTLQIAMNMKGLNLTQRLFIGGQGLLTSASNAIRGKNDPRLIDSHAKEQITEENKKDLDLFKDQIQKVRAFKEEWKNPQARPILNGLNRFTMTYQKLTELRGVLDSEKKKFLESYEKDHAKYLPPKIKSSSLQGGVREQVQEQQQQQQQQQQQTSVSRAQKGEKVPVFAEGFQSWETKSLLNPTNRLSTNLLPFNNNATTFLTKEADRLLTILRISKGEPIWKIVINPNNDLILMTKNDYALFERQKFQEKDQCVVVQPTRKGQYLILQDGGRQEDLFRENVQSFMSSLGFIEAEV